MQCVGGGLVFKLSSAAAPSKTAPREWVTTFYSQPPQGAEPLSWPWGPNGPSSRAPLEPLTLVSHLPSSVDWQLGTGGGKLSAALLQGPP